MPSSGSKTWISCATARWSGSPDARSRARVEKAHEQRVKRERRRAVTDGLDEVMRSFAGWYRDLAAVAAGADEAVLNYDYLFELQAAAFPGMVPGYLAAVSAVRRAMRRFRYNVDARLRSKTWSWP